MWDSKSHLEKKKKIRAPAPTQPLGPCCISVEAMVQTVAPPDEHVLIHRAQRGERQAFAVLVQYYWDRLYRWLCHLAHDRHTAEDLAQEAFLKALAGLSGFRAGTNFQAWLFRIAHNAFANHTRSQRRSRQPFPEEMPSSGEGPAEQAMSREMLQLLARTVGRLPNEYRAAFLLRVEENMSFQAIAEVLEITEQTARWRVFKARQKLMDVLAPELEQEKS
jgi:RNA polymerase sigma-70 factor (ECF subfamily)